MQQPNGNKPSRNPLRGNDRNQEGGKPGQGQGKGKPDAPRRPRIPTWIVGVLILGLLAWNAWRIFGPDDGESRYPPAPLRSRRPMKAPHKTTEADDHHDQHQDPGTRRPGSPAGRTR